MLFDTNFLKNKILQKLSILDENKDSKIVIQNPQNVIIKNNNSSSDVDKYDDEEIETDSNPESSEISYEDDETEVLDLASDPNINDDKIIDIPKDIPEVNDNISYEDEDAEDPNNPSEELINNVSSDFSINDDNPDDISNAISPPSMLNPDVQTYEDEDGDSPQSQPQQQSEPFYNDESQIDPNTGMPVQQAGAIDPNTGMPVQQAGAIDPMTGMPVQQAGAIDPNTGMPVQQAGAIDPNTGMPVQQAGAIDPMTGMPVDQYSDEVNPEMTIGNSSEVVKGAPIPLEDLSRIEDLKTINSQMMQIRQILEKELDNRYNKVEEQVIEAVNYFRSIIANLDSFSTSIDDIIFKYKRFILAVLTEINNIKEAESTEKDTSNNKSKKDTDTK